MPPNENLRRAMVENRFTVDRLAEIAEVDAKTVQRWLEGRVPHPRTRWAVAEALGEDEDHLWPTAYRPRPERTATDELVGLYPHRADVRSEIWWRAISGAAEEIALLGYAMLHLPEQHPDLVPVLKEKALEGCRIRVALVDPDSEEAKRRDAEEQLNGGLIARIRTAAFYFRDLGDCEGIEMRLHSTPMYNSIFRFGKEMFVTPHLYGVPGSRAPLLHLQRRSNRGAFERFVHHFESIWDEAKPFEEKR